MDGAENPVTEKRTVYFECKSGCTLIESITIVGIRLNHTTCGTMTFAGIL